MRSGNGRASLWVPASCGALLAVAWTGYWWLAVPRHDVCALTWPAPAGCGSDRVPVAAFWSVVTGCAYSAMVFLEVKTPGSRWRVAALLVLVVGTVWGFFSVLYA